MGHFQLPPKFTFSYSPFIHLILVKICHLFTAYYLTKQKRHVSIVNSSHITWMLLRWTPSIVILKRPFTVQLRQCEWRCQIYDCFFHLSQSWLRRIKMLQIYTNYMRCGDLKAALNSAKLYATFRKARSSLV
jgi:hypothetical protein